MSAHQVDVDIDPNIPDDDPTQPQLPAAGRLAPAGGITVRVSSKQHLTFF